MQYSEEILPKKGNYRRLLVFQKAGQIYDMTCHFILLFLLFLALPASSQIKIGGNVYGGGNEGDTGGNTTVTIHTGKIKNVFGGARMADVNGRAFVNIDGENGSGEILIGNVYGGNDIAGTVGKEVDENATTTEALPSELTEIGKTEGKNDINDSWVAFVRTSKMSTEDYNNRIIVGTIYGGGNGDYDYFKPGDVTGKDANNNNINATQYEIRDKATGNLIAQSATAFTLPTLTKTYLELKGGCLAHVFGGGNNVTVTQNTTICINNSSSGLQGLLDQTHIQEEFAELAKFIDQSTFQSDYTSLDFNFARVFGGNNKAEMKIRPVWNLQQGKIRDLYSGGNEGNMTHPQGLVLDIHPLAVNNNNLSIVNVYGGCRRADIRPTNANGTYPNSETIQISGYHFPAGLSARTIVRGGHITNVYGGNDISGHVFGGNAVGIYTTVYGDVYGGGNGSYSYTDNPTLGALPIFRDFYYNPEEVQAKERLYSGDNSFTLNPTYKSVEALNIFRPNAEQVSILVKGTDANHPTIIRGSLYLGGNSASLKTESSTLPSGTNPKVELKIGSYTIIDKVFLGNNGANMVTEGILKRYAGKVNPTTGATVENTDDGVDFNSMDFTDATRFSKYMEGCAMSLHPSVVFENDENGDQETYIDYSSQIGSFYCGGNVGSMTCTGTNTINFDKKVIIFDKFVGGCNTANVNETNYNAKYLGGMIGSAAEQEQNGMLVDPTDPSSAIKDCLVLNFSGLKIQPKRWKQDTNGDDILDTNGNPQLEWNTIDHVTGAPVENGAPISGGRLTINKNDPEQESEWGRRLKGGNIYGGCYESGHMNGNVVINLIDDIIDLKGEHLVFDVIDETTHNPIFYENETYTITKRHSGVILDEQGMDALGVALNVFGGGYGPDSEVWGSTTVNLRAGHTFQIFGGGQQGPIGKSREDNGETPLTTDYEFKGKHYAYDARYSTYVNMEDDDHDPANATGNNFPEIQFIYGGSYEAPIMGNTHVYLGNGRIFNSFGGSCNADILGHTETYVGKSINRDGGKTDGQIINSFPYVIDHIYGGNDLGGRILGEKRAKQYPSATDAQQALTDCYFTTHVGTTNGQDLTKVYGYDASSNPNPSVLTASAYIEYTQGRIVNIFGGCYGDYDYTDEKYRKYCDENGNNINGFSKPRLGNAFINFKPVNNNNTLNTVAEIYGAGEGAHDVFDRDMMQERSYILIDIPQDMQQFRNTVVFGAGAYSGLGMEFKPSTVTATPDSASAVIDLVSGQIKNVYGGSYNEGVTRRTVVNVPAGSTIAMVKQMDDQGKAIANTGCIFGGAYGQDVSYPCDVIESHVNYSSNDATVQGGIFGGNNKARRTFFTNVSINSTVWSNKTNQYQGTVYGAGFGPDTWAHYTNIDLNDHAVVYKLYGGGSAGPVLNEPSLVAWKNQRTADNKTFDLSLISHYTGTLTLEDAATTENPTPLSYTGYGFIDHIEQNPLALRSELANDIDAHIVNDLGTDNKKSNTNVRIHTGATVTGYVYGGGYGPQAVVSGDTYVALLGGRVEKDIYAAGESGPVMCQYPAAESQFTACTNAYVKSGRVRNVYGGGWKGDVGKHSGSTLEVSTDDVGGLTNVVVGTLTGTGINNGIPAVERNVYGGGEGGAIYGTANVSVNNGYIGFRFDGSDPTATTSGASDYAEELDDVSNPDPERRVNGLLNSGNIFGGGYVANSYTENTKVYMYKGVVRGSVYGGGEIGPIGRGTVKDDEPSAGNHIENANAHIFKPGGTHVYIYGGLVQRNVFGGGRGYDNWGGDGTELYKDQPEIIAKMDLNSKGFVFGETDVHIYGGTIGTPENLKLGYGNVFGGGDIGFVYSGHGKRFGERGDALSTTDGLPVNGGGFYYNYYNDDLSHVADLAAARARGMTIDCAVEVAPYCQVLPGKSIEFDVTLQTDDNGNFVLNSTTGMPIQTSGKKTFEAGEYVPYEYLNLLKNKNADETKWSQLDISGVTIRNAVFAGGNVSAGSDQIFVNTNTVYGNATAALRDVYHRDLITVGTEHTGGLYGDGNLTFVDGFRELHIANYGTDFYGLSQEITKEEYDQLTDRERAYFELEYECIATCTDKNSHEYAVGDRVKLSDFAELFEGTQIINADGTPNAAYWQEMGICTIYAGRLLNTIQRADFVGVWGSRLVLQGARDRVPEVADFTEYTVNRVDEISLNKMNTQISDDSDDDASHGNYFGIYSIVNYLGNLTSDNFFDNKRTTNTNNSSLNADGKSYYQWKKDKMDVDVNYRYRNNATSYNKVALASGVYLELVNEPTEGSTGKDWGYVTGVIELDLINVKQGLGGGYVYAKNEHGVKTHHTNWSKVTLTPYNQFARTYRRFTYTTDDNSKIVMETSGNFVHNVKQIVDDCYPTHNKYLGEDASPAHYWYIKGSIYVYDQYISAYTGSATAYSESVNIPLSIQAGAHGRLTLREVQPNLYAYYDKNGNKLGSEGADETFEINGKHYALNDPITYWDWSMLDATQQGKFVKDTYTVVEKCKVGNKEYPVGYTMRSNESEYTTFMAGPVLPYDADTEAYAEEADSDKPATFFLRPSNNVSHDNGYILIFDMENPKAWDKYYTQTTNLSNKVSKEEYEQSPAGYIQGPTYHMIGNEPTVYGQKYYNVSDVIDNTIYESYPYATLTEEELEANGQAKFEPAWVTTQAINVNGATINPGVAITRTDYYDYWGSTIMENVNVVPAKVITSTLQLKGSDYLYAGDILSEAAFKAQIQAANPTWSEEEVNNFYTSKNSYIADAYYCIRKGNYGGKRYSPAQAYEALEAWSAMSPEDREHFRYNYDAFDVLIDPTYGGSYGYKPQYDGYAPGSSQLAVEANPPTATAQYNNTTPLNPALYSKTTAIDYSAVYNGTTSLTYTDTSNVSKIIYAGEKISREQYEAIPNEKYHYSTITVTSPGVYYVVKEAFISGDIPYTAGEVISKAQYEALDPNKQRPKVQELNFPESMTGGPTTVLDDDGNPTTVPLLDDDRNPTTDDRGYDVKFESVLYYYCRDSYTIANNNDGHAVTSLFPPTGETGEINKGKVVPLGTVIGASDYGNLVNKTVSSDGHQLFTITGNIPVETSTLYVSRESDIYDLSKEKIITVIYLYEYEESDESGMNIQPISERHIVNIHLQFESGVPQIGELTKPNTVLPGSTVGLKVPKVTTGAFEVLSSGWEIFDNPTDAAKRKNGKPFVNNNTPVYWYQDNYQIAYYTKTYLGKSYSNYVPLSVGNYHDIADVMADKDNHMFIDHKDAQKYHRGPKIYIDNRNITEANTDKSELDMLKDLFDLTLYPKFDGEGETLVTLPAITSTENSELVGHNRLDPEQIGATKNLEFILKDNVAPKKYTDWTPIGTDTQDPTTKKFTKCFEGTLHGDGYTISGLNNSLFKSLCGEVYNLGVTGTFTSAGIVETGTGYIENCWINTTGTPSANTQPLFNTPARNATMEEGRYNGKLIQVVNSYYPTENGYSFTADATHGTPIAKPLQSFYYGEVAYDLNGFYLNKRYYDHADATGYDYKYLDSHDLDNNNKPKVKEEHYPETSDFDYEYVSSRYANVDFTFAGGTVPSSDNERLVVDTENQSTYYCPIWPDDYLFFGQRLTYGYVQGRPHQDTPAYIIKTDGRLETDETNSNRVYRAPAYFQNKEMSMAYYNPQAIFVDHKNGDENFAVHRNMTAIDFTGSNGDVAGGYQLGLQTNGHFFPPLLDIDRLTALRNEGLTKNWLVYTPDAISGQNDAANSQTNRVVLDYLREYDFESNVTNPTYRSVAPMDENYQTIHGHAVVKTGTNSFSAPADRDHFLVDKQDFNAPISYTFASGKRMWYQRRPDLYVDRTKGWEGISIPFSAELVTTQQKGEITHFYSGSTTGHEYWLREFKGMQKDGDNLVQAKDEDDHPIANVYLANFNHPDAITGGDDKTYTNTFLWDYYYQYSSTPRQDKNTDTYQQDYYASPHTFEDYGYSSAAKPYIIGFPGTTYYEFDLSDGFKAANTKEEIPQLAKQVITFASPTGITVAVSDDECGAGKVTEDGYTFTPNYLGKPMAEGYYQLNSEGSSYVKVAASGTPEAYPDAVPFRPYFTYTSNPSGARTRSAEKIIFSQDDSSFGIEKHGDPTEGELTEGMDIYAKKHKIIVTSNLREVIDVRIVNTAGITVATFTIQPGETVNTPVHLSGVYMVRSADGRFIKKQAVK